MNDKNITKSLHIWAPNWKITVGVVFVFTLIYFISTSAGHDPALTLTAALFGGIGGFFGGGVSELLKMTKWRNSWFVHLLPIMGFFLGALVSKGVAKGLGSMLGPQFVSNMLLGSQGGALCGLLPQLKLNGRNKNYGNMMFWLCAFLGLFGGLILAIPGAAISTLVGIRKYK